MTSSTTDILESPTPSVRDPLEPALSPKPEPSPLRELLTIAWPTVLTMTSHTLMQFVDSFMVSRIDPLTLSAQGNGSIYAFVPMAFFMGVVTMTNTFVAQHLGAGRPRQAPRYAWNAIWISLATVLVLWPYAYFMPDLFRFVGHKPELVALESVYGRMIVSFAFFAIAARGLHHFFFGLHRPKVVFVSALIGNSVNIVLNFLLIFGMFGFPKLGLLGAAIGTIVGSVCEFIVPMIVFLGRGLHEELGTRDAWKPDWLTIRQLWRIGWPKAMTWVNELACWTYFMTVLLAKFGEASLASGWIVLRYMHLSFMPAVGISTAVTAVVGRYIGAGKPDTANHRAWLGVKIGMGYMGLCALAFVLFRRPMISVFVETDDAKLASQIVEIGMVVLVCAAVFQLFDALAITLSGALAGAGDTLWPGVVMFITAWVCIVGVGTALVEWYPELGALGPWIGAAAYIIVLGIAYWWRWISGTWRTIKLVDHG